MSSDVTATGVLAGKYLTFGLADETYGLDILRVQEIVGLLPITRVPRLPSAIAGLVNLRGRVVPVVDMRAAFGLPAVEATDRTCIVIVRVMRAGVPVVIGAIVDDVSDVVWLGEESIESTPQFAGGADTSFIRGVGRLDERVILLLEIDEVLSDVQIGRIEEVGREAREREATSSEGELQ